MNIEEGKESKGGTNLPPTIPPPEPPKGQGGKESRPCRVCGKRNPIGIPVCWECDENFEHWPKNEEILRELLFMEHHCDAKYGDDGEMQCGKCMIDFRRDSAEEIKRKIAARNLERMKKWSEENPDYWEKNRGIQPGKIPSITGYDGSNPPVSFQPTGPRQTVSHKDSMTIKT